MGHTGRADELLEVPGDEMAAVVGDDLGLDFRMLYQGAREDDLTRSLLLTRALPCLSAVYLARLPLAWFHISLGLGLAQLVVDDGAVEHQ
jgi:hypothetical protein